MTDLKDMEGKELTLWVIVNDFDKAMASSDTRLYFYQSKKKACEYAKRWQLRVKKTVLRPIKI